NPNARALWSITHNVITSGFARGDPFLGDESWTGTTTLEIDRSKLRFGEKMELAFLDPNVPELGFDALEVHLSAGGHHLADRVFTSAAAAAAGGLRHGGAGPAPPLFGRPPAAARV